MDTEPQAAIRCGNAGALVATGLKYGYRRTGREQVIGTADFEIPPGRIVAIVGPNGAGKSTLLRTIIGLLRPLAGTLTIGGLSPDAHRRQHGIGYLPEQMNLPANWTARGLLAMVAAHTGSRAAEDLPTAVEIAGIDFDPGKRVQEMSKGMRQRVALAMALLPLPDLLILDEPEAGLDPAQRVLLRGRLREFAATSRTILVASHDVNGIGQIADQVFLMRDGGIEPVTHEQLLDPALLLQLFSGRSLA